MDKLKKYLEQHRTEMEVDAPAEDAWEHIASQMPGSPAMRRPVRRMIRYVVAASVVIAFSVGAWLLVRNDRVKSSSPPKGNRVASRPVDHPDTAARVMVQKERPAALPLQSPQPDELAAIDKSYTRLVHYQLRKLRATPVYAETPGYFAAFAEQLKQMDKDERTVRTDIKNYGLNDELLQQLINVYQQKLNVLKNLQVEINKMNNRVKEKAAPSEAGSKYYLNL